MKLSYLLGKILFSISNICCFESSIASFSAFSIESSCFVSFLVHLPATREHLANSCCKGTGYFKILQYLIVSIFKSSK